MNVASSLGNGVCIDQFNNSQFYTYNFLAYYKIILVIFLHCGYSYYIIVREYTIPFGHACHWEGPPIIESNVTIYVSVTILAEVQSSSVISLASCRL